MKRNTRSYCKLSRRENKTHRHERCTSADSWTRATSKPNTHCAVPSPINHDHRKRSRKRRRNTHTYMHTQHTHTTSPEFRTRQAYQQSDSTSRVLRRPGSHHEHIIAPKTNRPTTLRVAFSSNSLSLAMLRQTRGAQEPYVQCTSG